MIIVLSPFTGRLVGDQGPRLPLVIAGAALAAGAVASIWLTPATPLPLVLAIYLLFGLFMATVNPPITNTAVSGMPRSMTGVAASLASAKPPNRYDARRRDLRHDRRISRMVLRSPPPSKASGGWPSAWESASSHSP